MESIVSSTSIEAHPSSEAGQIGKEERILRAASALFARLGIRKTTIDEIARDAGMGKGTIYLYFKSKDEIFATLVRREVKGLMVRLRETLRLEGSAALRLSRYFLERVSYFEELRQRIDLSYEVMHEQRYQPIMQSLREEIHREEASIIQELLEAAIASGEFAVEDLRISSLAIIATIAAVEEDWIHLGRRMPAEDKVQILTQLLVHGLARRTP